MHRTTAHVKNRRANGLCGRAGCPIVSGDEYLCVPHKHEAKAYMAKYRAALRAARALAKEGGK